MQRRDFNLELTLTAPFMFPAIEAGRYGLDRVAMRNRHDHPIIPQDQIRGVLRDMALRLSTFQNDAVSVVPLMNAVFGTDGGDARSPLDASMTSARSTIFIDDLVAGNVPAPAGQSGKLTSAPFPRVKICDTSGAAERGHLLMFELVAEPGQDVTFRGKLRLFCLDVVRATEILELAVKSLLQIGAYDTIGFGSIKSASLTETSVPKRNNPVSSERVRWKFRIDRPFLVNASREADNAFVGSAEIPGAALKGCLIRNLELNGHDITAMSDDLAKLHVGFGKHIEADDPLPLSTAVFPDGKVGDLLLESARAIQANAPDPTETSGRQAKDWKRKHADRVALSVGRTIRPRYEKFDERIHTRIDPLTGTAKDEQLFATIAIDPGDDQYIAIVDLSQMPAGSAKDAVRSALSDNLVGLGKTAACIQSDGVQPSPHHFKHDWKSGGTFLIVLNAPALLAGPLPDMSAREAYCACWHELIPGAEMIDMIAEQHLTEGYVTKRFGRSQGGFRPFVVTKAGSAFLLDIPSAAVSHLEDRLRHGLVSTAQHPKAAD